jgi:hypothetical protein
MIATPAGLGRRRRDDRLRGASVLPRLLAPRAERPALRRIHAGAVELSGDRGCHDRVVRVDLQPPRAPARSLPRRDAVARPPPQLRQGPSSADRGRVAERQLHLPNGEIQLSLSSRFEPALHYLDRYHWIFWRIWICLVRSCAMRSSTARSCSSSRLSRSAMVRSPPRAKFA